MQFETVNDCLAQDDDAGPAAATSTPYETARQARADMAGVYAHCARSGWRGVMGKAGLTYLSEACKRSLTTSAAVPPMTRRGACCPAGLRVAS